jgi:HPt (histidine-containing phosphotransfer) domain-containing protein
MIDWNQLRQLQDDVGKDEMKEIVEVFILEVDEAIETLESNYNNLSFDDRCASFHFLKGCASNLGFKDFGNQCSAGEDASENRENPNFNITELTALYVGTKKILKEEYDKQMPQ